MSYDDRTDLEEDSRNQLSTILIFLLKSQKDSGLFFFTASTWRQQPFNLAADAAAKDVTITSFLTGIATGTTANRNAAKTSPECEFFFSHSTFLLYVDLDFIHQHSGIAVHVYFTTSGSIGATPSTEEERGTICNCFALTLHYPLCHSSRACPLV